MAHGTKYVGPSEVYYSYHVKNRKFDVGFVVGDRLRRQVLPFTILNECLAQSASKGKGDYSTF